MRSNEGIYVSPGCPVALTAGGSSGHPSIVVRNRGRSWVEPCTIVVEVPEGTGLRFSTNRLTVVGGETYHAAAESDDFTLIFPAVDLNLPQADSESTLSVGVAAAEHVSEGGPDYLMFTLGDEISLSAPITIN